MQYTVTFTASDFGVGAPADPVSGTVTYDTVANQADPILSLSNVNLTIDGYTYGLPELGFFNSGFSSQIGGNLNTVANVIAGTDDVRIVVNRFNGMVAEFHYATSGSGSVYSAGTVNASTSQGGPPVPEPGTTLPLLAVFLAGTAWVRKRRNRPPS